MGKNDVVYKMLIYFRHELIIGKRAINLRINSRQDNVHRGYLSCHSEDLFCIIAGQQIVLF